MLQCSEDLPLDAILDQLNPITPSHHICLRLVSMGLKKLTQIMVWNITTGQYCFRYTSVAKVLNVSLH
jgi:hypothetical protein